MGSVDFLDWVIVILLGNLVFVLRLAFEEGVFGFRWEVEGVLIVVV